MDRAEGGFDAVLEIIHRCSNICERIGNSDSHLREGQSMDLPQFVFDSRISDLYASLISEYSEEEVRASMSMIAENCFLSKESVDALSRLLVNHKNDIETFTSARDAMEVLEINKNIVRYFQRLHIGIIDDLSLANYAVADEVADNMVCCTETLYRTLTDEQKSKVKRVVGVRVNMPLNADVSVPFTDMKTNDILILNKISSNVKRIDCSHCSGTADLDTLVCKTAVGAETIPNVMAHILTLSEVLKIENLIVTGHLEIQIMAQSRPTVEALETEVRTRLSGCNAEIKNVRVLLTLAASQEYDLQDVQPHILSAHTSMQYFNVCANRMLNYSSRESTTDISGMNFQQFVFPTYLILSISLPNVSYPKKYINANGTQLCFSELDLLFV